MACVGCKVVREMGYALPPCSAGYIIAGATCTSNAHTTCTRVLEAELCSEALQTSASPQPPASPHSELGERDSTPISVVDSSTSKQHSPTPTVILPDESSREYFQETEYEGTSYRVGDIVYVTARYSAHEYHTALIIQQFWK